MLLRTRACVRIIFKTSDNEKKKQQKDPENEIVHFAEIRRNEKKERSRTDISLPWRDIFVIRIRVIGKETSISQYIKHDFFISNFMLKDNVRI